MKDQKIERDDWQEWEQHAQTIDAQADLQGPDTWQTWEADARTKLAQVPDERVGIG